LRARLYVSAIIILTGGLCSAVLIYVTAEEDSSSGALYEMVHSKPYTHDLQRFGGKAAVLFDEFNRWFAALWQGKALAFTVAWISLFVALGIFLLARRWPRA
jgi:hypothetical protein